MTESSDQKYVRALTNSELTIKMEKVELEIRLLNRCIDELKIEVLRLRLEK